MIRTQPIKTLRQFYALMVQTRDVRRNIVAQYLENETTCAEHIDSLRSALALLKQIPKSGRGFSLQLDEHRDIAIELDYETVEMQKDILFLSEGEEAFERHLRQLHPSLARDVERGLTLLRGVQLHNLITDRDGTINNYCGRYLSSIQSAYNAIFVARFAQRCVRNAVVLTSAPLENGGLVDMSTIPEKMVVNAGSKGREYRDLRGKRGALDVPPHQQERLDELNRRIIACLKEPRHQKFADIGSGLQRKFGQTTMARQDVSHSIAEQESSAFLSTLERLVKEVDPDGQFFRIEDTGLDVEIILTVSSDDAKGALTDFDKGDGVAFLNQRLNLRLDGGGNLVCGDTNSDVPMLEQCLQHSQDTWTVFVTEDVDLKKRVSALTPNHLFVDQPDTLVTLLHELSRLRR